MDNLEKNLTTPETEESVSGGNEEEVLLAVPDALLPVAAPALTAGSKAEETEPATAELTCELEALEITPGGGFQKFGFCPQLMQAIAEAGFTEPTPIQVKAIPELLAGRDLIGQALTGTGKTAAFGLPILEKIRGVAGLQLLVLVPTRELAAQVSSELYKLGRYAEVHTAAFTGGQSYSRQEQLLRKGINALVATPGRLLDLIESGLFADITPSFMVVDEADEMLDMGFLEDVRQIFAHFSGTRQTMLFSATMPRPVVALAQSILHEPVEITTAVRETTNNDIEQLFYIIEDSERTNAIIRLIDAEDVGKAIIFCRTREETDQLNILLGGRGYNVNCLHGDMEQAQRSRVMGAFRRGEIDILVATDVAARGLDVDDVTHVFNFHMPFDSRGYVHRIGRTGRAGKAGTAITLVTPREMRQLESIRRTVGAQLEHRCIPTRSEVTSQRLKRIFQELHEYELDIDLLNQVQTLSVNQDILVLMAKLLKHQLSGGADQGPEHIGVAGQRLSRLLEPRSREESRRQAGRHGRPFSRRGGGGEGQRHRQPIASESPAAEPSSAKPASATAARKFDRDGSSSGRERGRRQEGNGGQRRFADDSGMTASRERRFSSSRGDNLPREGKGGHYVRKGQSESNHSGRRSRGDSFASGGQERRSSQKWSPEGDFGRNRDAKRPFQERGRQEQANRDEKFSRGQKNDKGKARKTSSGEGQQSRRGTGAPAANKGWYLDAFRGSGGRGQRG